MSTRRFFLKTTAWAATALSTASITACVSKTAINGSQPITQELKISLAQWSLNRAFFGGQLDATEFANIAVKDYGINAIEYVNGFYMKQGKDEKFWQGMKERSNKAGVKNLLIMVDEEGDLGNPNSAERNTAVTNHYKWVHAAKILGCHSIRVNAFGEGEKPIVRAALIDGMGQLAAYAAKENINVLIENHGLYSSDGQWIAGIMKAINQANFGTLPDFGNWCLNAKWGSTQNNKCKEVYDRYQGVSDFLPYAKGVSAKSYDFDATGKETIIDYYKMLQIVKKAGYNGYIGIEYEGERLSEPDGIRATRTLLEKAWVEVS